MAVALHCLLADTCPEWCQKTCKCLESPVTWHTPGHSPHDVALDAELFPRKVFSWLWLSLHSFHDYLFPHGFRIGDCGRKEAIPLQPAIESCPVIVAIASVREAPGNESAKLLVHGITWLPLSTRTDTTEGIFCTAIFVVLVGVTAA